MRSGPKAEAAGREEAARLRGQVARLQRELAEKSDLLREVNHRAKNNLQMAMALLAMQGLASDNEAVRDALKAASDRLGHLARVHELLYQRGDDAQAIHIDAFLDDVAGALARAFGRSDIALTLVAEPIVLAAGEAINVALIAGEAALNAYKHAFPKGGHGTISITVKRVGALVELVVRDDGVGFSTEERHGSLGMRLLRALGRGLGSETQISCTDRTEVKVAFLPAAG